MNFEVNNSSEYSKFLENSKKENRVGMHSFHRYYGKLIPAIPNCFIDKFTKEGDLIFDPFTGSGTTAVESCRMNRDFVGVEINPLSVSISKTKTSKLSVNKLLKINNELMKLIKNSKKIYKEEEKPYLLNRDHWFKDFVQNDLLNIRDCIKDYFKYNRDIGDEYEAFYYNTLSAIIKNVSNADTRHVFPGVSKRMRQLESEGLIKIDVYASFIRAINKRAKYYEIYEKSSSKCTIIHGDSTTINLDEFENSVDLIVTNPPYISSVRYIETLKLEMYWMESIVNSTEYDILAHKMLGNDKLRKNEYQEVELTKYKEINELIESMLEIDKKSAKIISEFFINIEKVIIKMNKVLKTGKKAVIKISDSKMKKIKIETGKFMTQIAENNGFKLIDVFLDEIDNNSRSLTTARNSYSDIITHDYIIVWEKI